MGEADTGVYGGDDPNDNSGSLRYVRVEFAGVEFSPDNELNGIAFQGVGRGGTYEFIQVHMNRDDALEWFGGTADIKYAVASNAADDSFDWTFGWSGRAQFIVVHQRGDDADNGIEADNNEFNNNLLPRSNPQIYNITMCGDPATATRAPRACARPTCGAARRSRSATSWSLDSRRPASRSETTNTRPPARSTTARRRWALVCSGISASSAARQWPRPSTRASRPTSTAGGFPNVRANVDGGLSPDCVLNHENPNFQPVSAATLAGGQLPPIQPPNDGFFEAVTFIGAVPPPPADDWTRGWTSYPAR